MTVYIKIFYFNFITSAFVYLFMVLFEEPVKYFIEFRLNYIQSGERSLVAN